MKNIFWIVLLICVLPVAVSCGRRTSPEPINAATSRLLPVQQVSAHYQGTDLVFSWKALNTNVLYYRLNVQHRNPECLSCRMKVAGRLLLDPETRQTTSEMPFSSKLIEAITFQIKNDRCYWRFPEAYLKSNSRVQGTSYAIDYFNMDHGLSRISKEVVPLKPLPIPAPEISVLKLSDAKDTLESDTEHVLILKWQKHQEAIRHEIQKDGSTSEEVIYYGMIFYRVAKGSDLGRKIPINRQPLLGGSFSLVNFFDLLYASHQDRFGNESAPILVFDGVYE